MKKCEEIDFVRCVLMAIVILVHVVNFGELYPAFKQSMFTFFMPAFLIITGYLVNIDKSMREFLLYLRRIMLPYIIMVTGFSVLSYFLPVRDGLTELSLAAIAEKVFVTSIGPYWFLYDMIICGAAYYLVFKLAARLSLASRLSIYAFLLYVLAIYVPLLTFADATLYFLGVVLRQFGVSFLSAFRPSAFSLLPFLLLIMQRDLWHRWLCLLLPFFAISFLSWCRSYVPVKLRKAMDFAGRNTLPIYIFHPIFTLASKFYLPFFTFDPSGILHAVVTIVLGFVGSIAIALVLDKTRLVAVFGMKRMIR
ncbi:MAG: acyltransferase [Prevotellaceae bacterium]|nr:acyltransferase [Prevotellaceae bacterium]